MGDALSFSTLGLTESELLRFEREESEPERNLWAAVMIAAIRDAMGIGAMIREDVSKYHGLSTRQYVELTHEEKNVRNTAYLDSLSKEATEWLDSEDADVGSFRWICSKLGLNCSLLLAGAHALVASKTARNKFRRRISLATPTPLG